MTGRRLRHGTRADAAHDDMKLDPTLWDRLVIPIGTMPDGDGAVLELGNCRLCLSTIARPARKVQP